MSERINGLARLLPGKTSLADCSLEELQHITKRFPFFSPAQFLLLQKLNETDKESFEAQQQKAVLYYHDPLLFQHLFLPDTVDAAGDIFSSQQTSEAVPEQLSGEDAIAPISVRNEGLPEAAVSVSENQKGAHNFSASTPALVTGEVPAEEASFAQPAGKESTNASVTEEPDKVNTAGHIRPGGPTALPQTPLSEAAPIALSAGHHLPQAGAIPQNDITNDAANPANVPSADDTRTEENTPPTEKISVPTHKPAKEPALFEPFHTVDYFASQGIKISSSELPKDRLSSQVRSFTEWLKVMKRLPAADIEAAPQTNAEKSVETMASHSVEGGEVVTEAMAEVWARQGNRKKAIETYNKLSLLNPSKKAYFAAKIENLSGT